METSSGQVHETENERRQEQELSHRQLTWSLAAKKEKQEEEEDGEEEEGQHEEEEGDAQKRRLSIRGAVSIR